MYLLDFRSSAFLATALAPVTATATFESAKVSVHIESKTNSLPLDHGTIDILSGLFPSDLNRPVGSW